MNYVTIYLLCHFLLLYYFVIGWKSPTHNISSNHAIATQQKVYSRKIVRNYFLQLLKNKINYVDRFGMVSVRNANYLTDIFQKNLVFPFPPLPPHYHPQGGREKGKEKLDFLPLDNWLEIGFTYARRTKSIIKAFWN